jgi:hypothetical protein
MNAGKGAKPGVYYLLDLEKRSKLKEHQEI